MENNNKEINEIQKEDTTPKKGMLQSTVFTLTVILILILTILASTIEVFAADCKDIRNDVLRLHILANSDSKNDQDLKLMVRDEILKLDNKLFASAQSKENAKEKMSQSLDMIKAQAIAVLRKNGCYDNVNVELTNMYFTTREYDAFTLPAGMYDALRVTIGKAEGKNWWCVLYPPLCIPAVSHDEAMDILTDEESNIIKSGEKYQFKFAIVELIEGIKAGFSKK